MSETSVPGPAPSSVEPLRQLKAAEKEAEARVTTVRADVDRRLAELARETDEALAAARTAAQGEREALLARARADGEREAAEILKAGTQEAEAIRARPGLSARQKEALLGAVLGPLKGNGSR